MNKSRITILGAAALAVVVSTNTATIGLAQQDELLVLDRWIEWSNAPNLLQLELNRQARDLLSARRSRVRALTTRPAWEARQHEVKETLEAILGGFPAKSPLNARTVDSLTRPGYRIEKVVFESLPGFYVTGCLFLPTGPAGRRPAILNVIGHTGIAFRAPSYQRLILNLVHKGFIVLAIDPIGQGERVQYYDPALGRSLVGGPTSEHSYLGNQCFLTGRPAAFYFTWDGIRAIDYLVSRPEVDPGRIGVTGISGGGTQTSYIAALDERVLAAAPANYICGLDRLFESIGPQDAEQNLPAGVANGIDHADFLEVRAPKPTLVVATTRDFFSIQGARETVQKARSAFAAFGAEGNLLLAEDDYVHGYTVKTREAIYGFFQQHLENPGDPADRELALIPRRDLTVTRTGQLADSLPGETVHSLNRAYATTLLERLSESRRDLESHLARARENVRKLSGFVAPEGPEQVVFRGRFQREDHSVELYCTRGEGGTILPFVVFKPDAKGPHPAVIYLHPAGKSAAADSPELEQLVRKGYVVLAPDLSGSGELGSVNNAVSFLALQIGRSVVGVRAGDILRCVQLLLSLDSVDGSSLLAVAHGEMGIPLLHAAALDPRIRKTVLIEPLTSYQGVVLNRFYDTSPGILIGGVLQSYDLPDVAALLAPRPLLFLNPRDQLGQPVAAEKLAGELAVTRRAYGPGGSLSIRHLESFEPPADAVVSWLAE